MYQLSAVLEHLLICTFSGVPTRTPTQTSTTETVYHYMQVADANRRLIH
ncbi:MAG: hypothetical protein AAF708_14400 [Deinococcota bacterium]